MPWQVVEFLPHKKFTGLTVQAIPSSWVKLERDTVKAYYPKDSYNWVSVVRAIRNASQPSKEWDILPIKFCTPPFKTLEAAIEIEQKMAACEDTDLEAFLVAEVNKDGKRKRTKKNLKYPNESDDEDDRIPKPPSPVAWVAPKKMKVAVKDSSTNGGLRKLETTSIGVQCVSEEFDEVQLLACNKDREGLLSWKNEVLEEIRDLKRKFREYILEKAEATAELKGKITDLESHVKDSRTSPSSGSSENEFRVLHSFPVTDVIALLNLQTTTMENNRYREYLICFLKERSSNILSSHDNQTRAGLNRTVNDMCSTLMSNELAASFCMTGRSENKMAFEVHFSSIINIIFESVKAKCVNETLYDVVSVKRSIGEWFRVSKYRTAEGKQKRRATIHSTICSCRVCARQVC